MLQKSADSYCYNCHHPIQIGDSYCGNCGQKHHKGKYTLGRLLSEFIETNFNLDGRIFRSIGGLLRPGFLTNQYFAGKHKRYNTPIQIFLVIAVIFFSIVGWSVNDNNQANGFKLMESIEKRNALRQRDSLLTDISIRNKDVQLQNYLDSLHSEKSLTIDTLLKESETVEEIDSTKDNQTESFELNADGARFNIGDVNVTFKEDTIILGGTHIPAIEILNNSAQEVVDKYLSDRPWYQQVIFRQGLRLGLDQSKIMRFLMSRFPLLILLITPLFAALLKVLYMRRRFYFVEHFVFTLHLNSAALFLGLLSFIIDYYQQGDGLVFLFAFFAWLLYFLIAMKRFYNQGWIKTVFKYILALILGTVVAVIGSIIIFGIAFLIF